MLYDDVALKNLWMFSSLQIKSRRIVLLCKTAPFVRIWNCVHQCLNSEEPQNTLTDIFTFQNKILWVEYAPHSNYLPTMYNKSLQARDFLFLSYEDSIIDYNIKVLIY